MKEYVTMRYWIKFSKDKELRFISHLDLLRSWQRALRRACLPVAYSAGFNPHPRLSFASALPVGATSEAEYLDIFLTRPVSAEEWQRLQNTLPEGLVLLDWREVPVEIAALMSLIGAAGWLCEADEQEQDVLAAAIQQMLLSTTLSVERSGKKGKKMLDLRPLLLRLELCGRDVRMLLKMSQEGGAKPQEVLGALGLPAEAVRTHRIGLYLAVGERLQSPLAVLWHKNEVAIDAQKDYYQL